MNDAASIVEDEVVMNVVATDEILHAKIRFACTATETVSEASERQKPLAYTQWLTPGMTPGMYVKGEQAVSSTYAHRLEHEQ